MDNRRRWELQRVAESCRLFVWGKGEERRGRLIHVQVGELCKSQSPLEMIGCVHSDSGSDGKKTTLHSKPGSFALHFARYYA